MKPEHDVTLTTIHHLKFIHKNRYSTAAACLPFYAPQHTITLSITTLLYPKYYVSKF